MPSNKQNFAASFQPLGQKLTGYAARLSLICEMSIPGVGRRFAAANEISATAMEAGIAMARWFAAETKRIYAILNENEDERGVRQLVDYIRSRGGKIIAPSASIANGLKMKEKLSNT